jgi:hypothetical protein
MGSKAFIELILFFVFFVPSWLHSLRSRIHKNIVVSRHDQIRDLICLRE